MSRSAGLLSLLLVVGLCAGVSAEMVAYYPFNEGQGTTTVNATGNGNNGTLSSGVQWVTGVKGGGVRFDTAGERVVIGPLDPSAKNKAMTLAAWINWEGRGNAIAQQGIVGKREGWDPGTGIKWFWQTNPAGDLLFRADTAQGGTGLWWGNARLVPHANEWTHVAVTWNNGAAVQYVNAKQVDSGNITFSATADATVVTIGCVSATNNESFVGAIDEVRIYDTALTAAEIDKAMTGDTTSAGAPQPVTGATDVPRDVLLSWAAGESAASHDVYLGTASDAVDKASRTDGRGVLVSSGQSATAYKPAALLEFGRTYYWRVDEVNAPPSSAVHKGGVWSFTVEPYAYPITGITATASSSEKTTTQPANTVNGSGLANDLHSVSSDAMWVSSMAGVQPTWIRYQFDKAYKLQELWVWNHNTEFEPVLGYGFKDVTIETSLDGTTWTPPKDVQFAQATALAGYAHNTTVDLGGVMARYVRLTAKSNWSLVGLKQYGLSEVRFYYIPVEARAPQPAQNAEGVAVNAGLDWRPGRDVTSQKVSFGTDKAAVANGTATTKTVTDHGFTPGALDFGTPYYWKVDEVGTATYPGSVWAFTTQQYAAVDDFESYTDIEGNRIFDTWSDGWVNSTGSLVGNLVAPFAEKTILHGGKQAMPYEYNNVKAPYYSEAQRTFDTPQDWTVSGANTLSLWIKGSPVDFLQTATGITMSAAGADIYNQTDEFRYACKKLNGDGSITVRVDRLDNTNAWAKAGVMIRSGLQPVAQQVHVVYTAGNGIEFQYRPTVGANTTGFNTADAATPLPRWVRLTRKGNTFTGEFSNDGKTWSKITSGTSSSTQDIVMLGGSIYIGLAVTSHLVGTATIAQFSNVQTTGTTGEWQVTAIAGSHPAANSPASLYVVVEDKAGKRKTVVNPDPAATTTSAWTEWRIALSDLTGINLAAVKKLTIGVGDSANPKAGGAGKLYIDDIQFGRPILPVGLVANYTFENSVKDVTSNGHDGTVLGTVTYVDGPVGKSKAVLFAGTAGNAVDLGTFNPSEKTGMLSVSLWAKWNGLSTQWQGLIGKRDNWSDTGTMWQIEANQTSGALSFSRYNITAGTAPALKVGEWTHIAVTFDKTTARFYVNGVQTGTGAFSFGPNRDAPVEIGCDNSGGGNPFNGALDEVRLYDTVLTPAEILTLAGK